jgi:hypothetical protein
MSTYYREEQHSSDTIEKDSEKGTLGESRSPPRGKTNCLNEFLLFTVINEVIAVEEFDDPNLDRDEVIVAVLGPPSSRHHAHTAR